VKVSTFTMNAKSIGEWGEHSNPDHYKQFWADYKIFDKLITDFEWDDTIKENIRRYFRFRFLKDT